MSYCDELAEHLATAVDGRVPQHLEAHIDTCDACCDLLHDATVLGDAIKDAGRAYHHAGDFEARVLAAIDPDGVEPTRPMRKVAAFR
jgi:hypothetical protein